jgi:hypothetical protein
MPIPDPNPEHKIPVEFGQDVVCVFMIIIGSCWLIYSMHKAYLGYGTGGFAQRTAQNMFYCCAIGPHFDIERQEWGVDEGAELEFGGFSCHVWWIGWGLEGTI